MHETLTELSESTFLLSARLSRRVTRLPFTRPGDGDRRRTIRVMEPVGARIERDGAQEAIVSGIAFDQLAMEVPVHQHDPENDYAPFIVLTDGGVLVYTGQLDLGAQETTDIHYVFVPRPPHSIVLPGSVATTRAEWTASGNGTYVAFTHITPLEGPDFIAVVDPGFPSDLRRDLDTVLPLLLHHYTEALGERAGGRPTVFVSFNAAEGPTRISIKGGVVGGVLQIDVRLGSVRHDPRDPNVPADVRFSLAHEAAHLWTELARSRGSDWVHEGAAELLSWRALRAVRRLPIPAYLERLSWAASACAALRGARSLDSDRVPARYACGAVIEFVASGGEAPGAERVWKRLLASARGSGVYDADAFFAACEQAGSPGIAVRAAASLAQAGNLDGAGAVERALAAVGYSVRRRREAPPRFRRFIEDAGAPDAAWLSVRPRDSP